MNGIAIPQAVTRADCLADEISTLYAHINVATFALLEKIQQFDEQGLYARFHCKSTAHWLNYACGISLAAGREKVRVARALIELPKIRTTFGEGRVSYSKVRALTRIATPASEAALLNVALHSTASQTERIIRNQRIALRVSTSDAYTDRTLSLIWQADGTLSIKGCLSADGGALLLKALERCLEDVARDDDTSAEAQRADALVAVAEHALAGAKASGCSADRFQVCVHVSAASVCGSVDTEDLDDPPEIEGGGILASKTVERLSCDAGIVPIVESADGEPLAIGRRRRTVHPALRRALQRRDKGCRFPGCEQTRFVDAHHIVHWAHGGETNLDNLVLLCRHHHRSLHEGGYSILGRGNAILFRDPAQRCIPATCEDLSMGIVESLVKRVSAETSLHADVLRPELDTKPPDYGYIADVLSQLRDFQRPES
jgi:hypothetical protein